MTSSTAAKAAAVSSAGSAAPGALCAGLLVLAGLIEAACLEIVRIGDLRTGIATITLAGQPVRFLLFWAPFAAAFLLYLAAVWWVRRYDGRPDDGDRLLMAVILGGAVLFRITLLFSPPTLSDDIFRYVWDGKMQNLGINPYLYPPDAPEIAHLRDAYHPGINNKSISTIYPPFMQMVFRGVDRLWHSPYAMKTFFTGCDLGVMALVMGMLRHYRLPGVRVLIYAWNPLVLVETAGSGHNDPLALALMLAALLAALHQKPTRAMVCLTLSFLAKIFAVVLLPLFYRLIRRIRPFLLFPALVLAFYLPYAGAGSQLFNGLLVYGDKWRFNDSLFSIVLYMTGSLEHAKLLIGAAFLLVTFVLFRLPPEPMKTAYTLTGAYLLLTPTLQPWYVVWIVPFLCLFPNRAWLLLTGLVAVSYHVLIQFVQTGLWKEAEWVRYVQYLPFYALLLADGAKRGMRDE
jgi:hypothetical protein